MREHPYVGQIAAFIPSQTEGIPCEDGKYVPCIITHVYNQEKVNAMVFSMHGTPQALGNIPYYRTKPASQLGYSHALPLDYDQ